MQVILAKHAGFCEGVERAYKMAVDSIKKNKQVFILGDLVHNKDVVSEFEALGIKKVNNASEAPPGSILIITAHGSTPSVLEEAKRNKLKIVDTTCPWVTKAQNHAKELSAAGRTVVIVGDRKHPEVKGLLGWAGPGAVVVESAAEVPSLKLEGGVGVVAQTTQTEENFRSVVDELGKHYKDVVSYNTICGATSSRQCSARELAGQVDLMLVIGDVKSANSSRLKKICQEVGVETHQIQNDGELDLSWLKGKKRVGITAGASTPDRVIKKVLERINEKG